MYSINDQSVPSLKRETEINSLLSRLFTEIENLQIHFGSVVETIQPILRKEQPIAVPEGVIKGPVEIGTSLGKEMNSAVRKLQELSNFIIDIRSRIEL